MKQPDTLNYAGLKGRMGGVSDGVVGDVRLFRTGIAPVDTIDTTKFVVTGSSFLASAFPELTKVPVINGSNHRTVVEADDQVTAPAAYYGVFVDNTTNIFLVDNAQQIKRQLAGTGAWTVVRTPGDINTESPVGGSYSFAVNTAFWHNGYFYRFCTLEFSSAPTYNHYPRVYRCATIDGTWVKVLDGYPGSATGGAWQFVSNGSRLVMPCGNFNSNPVSGAMRYSNDNGATWSLGTGTGINSHQWQRVYWTGTEFVAFSYDQYTAKSADGIAWTVSAMTGTNKPYVINQLQRINNTAYCNGYFWGVASDGNTFLYSTDGIAWSTAFVGYTGSAYYASMYSTINGIHIFSTYGSGTQYGYHYVPKGIPANYVYISGLGSGYWNNESSNYVIKYGNYLRVYPTGKRPIQVEDFVDSFTTPTVGSLSPMTMYFRGKV